jgi:hypothetical protein
MLSLSGLTNFGGAGIQLARVLAPFAGQALHALASRPGMHSGSVSAAAATPQSTALNQPSDWFVVRSEERVEVPVTPHEEEPIFETHHSSQRFANTLSTYRQAGSVRAKALLGFGVASWRRTAPSCHPAWHLDEKDLPLAAADPLTHLRCGVRYSACFPTEQSSGPSQLTSRWALRAGLGWSLPGGAQYGPEWPCVIACLVSVSCHQSKYCM